MDEEGIRPGLDVLRSCPWTLDKGMGRQLDVEGALSLDVDFLYHGGSDGYEPTRSSKTEQDGGSC